MREEGETLGPDSPIIATSLSDYTRHKNLPKVDQSRFLRTNKIGDCIREAMRAADLPWRPYVFRSYCDTFLMHSESKRLITKDYRVFIMGHVGDIERTYTLSKHRLPPEVVQNMRESYRKAAARFLQTRSFKREEEEEDPRTELKALILEAAGCSQEEIESFGDLSGFSADSIRQIVEKKLGEVVDGALKRRQPGRGDSSAAVPESRPSQVVQPLAEVEDYISRGFEYVAELPGGKVVLRVPTLSSSA